MLTKLLAEIIKDAFPFDLGLTWKCFYRVLIIIRQNIRIYFFHFVRVLVECPISMFSVAFFIYAEGEAQRGWIAPDPTVGEAERDVQPVTTTTWQEPTSRDQSCPKMSGWTLGSVNWNEHSFSVATLKEYHKEMAKRNGYLFPGRPGVRSLEPRHWQGWGPSNGRKDGFLFAFSIFLWIPAFCWLLCNLCSCVHKVLLPLHVWIHVHCSSDKDICHWIWGWYWPSTTSSLLDHIFKDPISK
jgi:hypothetical protein